MKLLKYTVALSAITGVANAQGLFDVNPNETESESSPLRYNAGVTFGYDDNVNPTSGLADDSSTYARALLGANLVTRNARTSWDINAVVSQTRYFDTDANQDTTNARLAFNLNHRVSDRVRVVSRSFFNYGLDLGNFYGAITNRQLDEFIYFSTDNAVGYRWNDRLATYTGVSFSTLDYQGSSNDVDSIGLYNTFRYSVSPNTIMTASYRYTNSRYEVGGADRSSQYATLGFETKISDTAAVSADFGAQFSSETAPFAQISYVNRLTDQFRARAFARYSMEDTDTTFNGGRYDDKQTFRVGFAADYTLSPKVVLTVGGNYSQSDYAQGSLPALTDADWDLLNLYAGVNFRVNEAVSLRTSINYTDSDATNLPAGSNRDYDRLRYELGLNYAF